MKDYPSITISKKVGCGNIHLVFMEDEGAFYNLLIFGDMSKECPCGDSWFKSIARLLTFSLRRSIWEGTTRKGIVKQLLNQRCANATPNKDNIVSCADAIARAVLEYAKTKDLTEKEAKAAP